MLARRLKNQMVTSFLTASDPKEQKRLSFGFIKTPIFQTKMVYPTENAYIRYLIVT